MELYRLVRAREFAAEQLARVQADRDQAVATWDAKLAAAAGELSDAFAAEQAKRDVIAASLSDWTEYDGSGLPTDPENMVHWRVKAEWAQMKEGEAPSLTEKPEGGRADQYNWEWRGDEWQDIAAYRIVRARCDA